MIHVLFGADDFTAHEALAELARGLDADGMLAENTVRVEGASARPGELLGICQTVPFLGSHRLVIVRGLLAQVEERRGRPRAKRSRKPDDDPLADWRPFIDALPSLQETTTLVFLEGELDQRNPLLEALRPHAQVREFKALAQADVAGWILRRAPRHGLSLQARAVAALAGLIGGQLWLLDSELQKLATYAGGREVTEDDVRSLVSLARDPNVFAMADAIIEGRARDAVDLLQRLLDDGEPPQRLLAMIARQYRLMLLTKEQLESGARPTEVAARLHIRGFVMERLVRQAPVYTIETLRRAYRRILHADLNVKRGIQDDETALQLLIFELAALAGPVSPRGGRPGYNRPRSWPGEAPPGQGRAASGRR